MLPLKLHINGLYSYRHTQEIDFVPLTSNGIFGIFGKVGSGKSSILDAMTLALFGKVERINRTDGGNFQLLNLRSDALTIDFEFLGKNHTRYRCFYHVKRKKKKREELDKTEHRFFQWENESWSPLDTKLIEETLGLNYDHFKRTIIIPQGKFSEFLHLTTKERTDMLKSIFHLQEFDLFDATSRLNNENTQEIERLKGKMEGLNLGPPEQLNLWEEERKILHAQHLQAKEKEEKASIAYKDYELLQARFTEYKELTGTYREIQEKEPEIQQQEIHIALLEKYRENLHHPVQEIRKKNQQLQSETEIFTRETETYQQLTEKLENLKQTLSILESSYKEIPAWKEEARQLHSLSEWKTLAQKRPETEKRIALQETAYQESVEQLTSILQQKEIIKAEKTILEKNLKDPVDYEKLSHIFTLKETAEKNIALQQAKIATQQKEMLGIQETLQQQQETLEDFFKTQQITGAISRETLEQYLENLQGEKEQHLAAISVQEKLAEYSRELTTGEPCPLCGSTHHPQLLHIENISGEKTILIQQEQEIRRLKSLGNSLFTALEQSYANITTSQQRLDEYIQQNHILEEEMKNYDQAIQSSPLKIRSREILMQSYEEVKQAHQELKNKNEALSTCETTEKTKQDQTSSLQQALAASKQEFLVLQARMETIQQQFAEELFSKYQEKEADALLETAGVLLKKADTIEHNFITQQENYLLQEKNYRELAGKISVRRIQLEDLNHTVETLREEVRTKMEGLSLNREQVKVLADDLTDLPETRKKLQDFRQQEAIVKEKLQALESRLEGQQWNEEAWIIIQEQRDIAQKTLEDSIKLLAETDAKILALTTRVKESKEILNQLILLEERAEGLKEMLQLFRSSGFVNFISGKYLNDLVQNANHRFYKMSGQSLKLEVSGENDIMVRDYFNEGQLRHVKTLSGGQTFQASLCLALALAESVQQLRQNELNFFFLDEGFGSLDRDSLDTVLETLKALKKENRVVGIISHVEELKDEIGVYLDIINSENKGSEIIHSWIAENE